MLWVCLQWEIYDSYVEELQRQEKSKEKQKSLSSKKEEDKGKKKAVLVENQVGASEQEQGITIRGWTLHNYLVYQSEQRYDQSGEGDQDYRAHGDAEHLWWHCSG